MTAALCAAELLVLEGTDATAFAHAQFCNDVKSLAVGSWQWNAWLDPQGRVRGFFALLHALPHQLVAWFPLGGAASMRDALSRFVMRSNLEMKIDTWTLHTLDPDIPSAAVTVSRIGAFEGGHVMLQPGAGRVAWIAPTAIGPYDSGALNKWRLADMDAGLPLLSSELAGEFVPQALDLERLGAIRFDKGCYPGQEIAARLHFRGGNKRHLRLVKVQGEPPLSGTAIFNADHCTVGRILYGASSTEQSSTALAVITDLTPDIPLFDDLGKSIMLYT